MLNSKAVSEDTEPNVVLAPGYRNSANCSSALYITCASDWPLSFQIHLEHSRNRVANIHLYSCVILRTSLMEREKIL
jgi:hypothetical protein